MRERRRARVRHRRPARAARGAASAAHRRGAPPPRGRRRGRRRHSDRRHPRSADPRAADHRPEHRRQDRGAQDRGPARADGAGGPARARRRARSCRCSDRSSPTSATSSRSRPASARSRRTSPTSCRWTATLELPALVLLDEVGTGTDPNEGGALATAIVSHFKQRGALRHRDHALRRGEDVGHGHRRRHDGGVCLRSADLRADLSPDLRRAGPQPGDRDRAAARHAAAGRLRGARISQRRPEAACRAPGARRRAGARARIRSDASCSASGARSTKPAPSCANASAALAEREERFTQAAEREARRPRAPGAARHRCR